MNNYRKLALMSLFAASMGISGISQTIGTIEKPYQQQQPPQKKYSNNKRSKTKK